MHDDSAGEPQPRRRSALRHALGGLALLVVLAINLVLLDHAGISDWGSWTRHLRARFGGGREQMRKRVHVGMTRQEVEANIGGGGDEFVCASYGVSPGGGIPREASYPWPICRVTYPEYGFTVVYHCPGHKDRSSWTVSVIED